MMGTGRKESKGRGKNKSSLRNLKTLQRMSVKNVECNGSGTICAQSAQRQPAHKAPSIVGTGEGKM